MIAVYFFYGLAFFSLGLTVLLEARRSSELPLGKQLPWLAAFGLVHGTVEWIDMFMLIFPTDAWYNELQAARTILLPLSALFLVRFGVGLISEAGPLAEWLTFIPVALLVPVTLLIAYALIVSITSSVITTATDVWSRYLFYFSGCLLTSFGFVRQWHLLRHSQLTGARGLMVGAALTFAFNAIVAGLIVPEAPYGLAPWLNYDSVIAVTGVPVQVWRMLSAIFVTIFVGRALGVFEADRERNLATLRGERERAQQLALAAQLESREIAERWTDALVDTSRRIANMESVDSVLLSIVDIARKLLNADTTSLALWDENRNILEMKYHATTAESKTVDSIPVSSHLILDAVRTEHACLYPQDVQDLEHDWISGISDRQIRSAAIVPLVMDELSVGGVWVGRDSGDTFTAADLTGLEHLADQAVIALENAMMAEQLQSLAVMQERTRIAHEMHDGLAQILGYMNLEMQTVEALVEQGNQEMILAQLKGARQRIKEVQADVRENILSLRTTLAGDLGVIPALREYVEEFGVQTGIEVQLVSDTEAVPGLSPLAEAQLVRIVQEALANVRKHAQTQRAYVRITSSKGFLYVSVTDDGVGSDLLSSQKHFGLKTMRERAESVGGGVTIHSSRGEGTKVEIRVPLLRPSD